MTFLDNLEIMCKTRGESVSHALASAGLSPSLYPKWRNMKNFTPSGRTIQKLADYFGCSYQTLVPRDTTRLSTAETINVAIQHLPERDRVKILAYILFTYGKELPDEMQELRSDY